MSSSPPTTLGKYQIIREIARSNDIVYEAYDPLMNRRVAVKELAVPGGTTAQQREDRISRFKREAQAAGTLNHPNIMTVYELGQEGDRLFMAMEYLDGHTLRNEIDTKGFLPLDRAIEIVTQVLRGLEHAHKVGVVHRDIKPDNIQILSNGTIKITDFGIARLTFQPNLTMDGQVFGTPSYMSPEQVVGKDIDQRSDLFSAGIVLYEMIGGQKPFPGDSVMTITYGIVNKDPDRLSQIGYPLWQVIERVLDKSPALRYASAAELIRALEDSQTNASAGAMVVAPPPLATHAPAYPAINPAAPNSNPYLNPYPNPNPYQAPPVQSQGQFPPPVAYPYNPYSQPGQGGAAPHTPGFGGTPVYYPPPPRQPLIKPETKQFFGKLVIALLIMGSLFALIIVMINGVSKALESSSNSREDVEVVRQISQIDSSKPLEQQISELSVLIGKLKSEVSRKEAKASLAVRYEKLGKRFQASNDLVSAEVNFQNAVDADPNNPLLYTNLGSLYYQMASAAQDPSTQLGFMRQAAEAWAQAADKEPNPSQKSTYADRAAQAYYNYAWTLNEAGSGRQEVQSVLYRAQDYAPPGSQVERQIRTLSAQLNN